jgi:hypothetical protein
MLFGSLRRRPICVLALLIHAAGQKAAVHHQQVAGDKARGIGRKKYRSSSEFLHSPVAFHGRAQQKFPPSFRPIEESRIQIRAHHAGNQRVDIAKVFVSAATAALLAL